MTGGRVARCWLLGRHRRRRSASCSGSRRSSTSSRTRPETSASSATTSAIRPTSPIGFGRGVGVLARPAQSLEAPRPTRSCTTAAGPSRPVLEVAVPLPGALLLIAFGASAIVAWRLRHRVLFALDTVVLVALALGLGVIGADLRHRVVLPVALGVGARARSCCSRSAGPWWSSCAGGTAPATNAKLAPIGARRPRAGHVGGDASRSRSRRTDVTVQTPRLNETLGAVVGPTATALDPAPEQRGSTARTSSPGSPTRRRSVRRASDSSTSSIAGASMCVPRAFRPGATRYHVIDDRKPTLEVHLATGPDIANWRDKPQFTEVASFDPRSDGPAGSVRRAARAGRRQAASVTGLGTARAPRSTTTCSCSPSHPSVPVEHAVDDLADARSEHADGGVHRPAPKPTERGRRGAASERRRTNPRWFRPALTAGALSARSRCASRTCSCTAATSTRTATRSSTTRARTCSRTARASSRRSS